jgi:hypothetical protein
MVATERQCRAMLSGENDFQNPFHRFQGPDIVSDDGSVHDSPVLVGSQRLQLRDKLCLSPQVSCAVYGNPYG